MTKFKYGILWCVEVIPSQLLTRNPLSDKYRSRRELGMSYSGHLHKDDAFCDWASFKQHTASTFKINNSSMHQAQEKMQQAWNVTNFESSTNKIWNSYNLIFNVTDLKSRHTLVRWNHLLPLLPRNPLSFLMTSTYHRMSELGKSVFWSGHWHRMMVLFAIEHLNFPTTSSISFEINDKLRESLN